MVCHDGLSLSRRGAAADALEGGAAKPVKSWAALTALRVRVPPMPAATGAIHRVMHISVAQSGELCYGKPDLEGTLGHWCDTRCG
ncbi:hypothetical protein GCM10009680_45810 [Streptomyces yatensis]|uniref:Uncharacterized protein n=1 Tax=Streptomyces yatensis TaxID=155177 RepID=A0ABP4U8H7_9ACTN